MNNKRVHRISAEIKKIISTSLYNDVKDPRIDTINTGITEVHVTNDLSFATVYISVIGDEAKKEETLEGFRQASGFFKKEIAKAVQLRQIPKLVFKLDESTERGIHINNLIEEIHDKDHKNE
ncbi:MAG: 30S ribosome-binding factor RbfA [Gallicola sp.]|uniref:30S ribosome-binding factor RbfA n=1 Tax=Gallicola sp. Sow4_E12 TaxID=3438785 RepID=UPI0017FD1FD5|nr:30S ribosome-binding factor RbfA [Gallicola sp.]